MDLKLDRSECSTYNAQLSQELDNYNKVVGEIAKQFGDLSGAWSGSRSSNFIGQFNTFLQSLGVASTMIEKSEEDLKNVEISITNTDEGGGS